MAGTRDILRALAGARGGRIRLHPHAVWITDTLPQTLVVAQMVYWHQLPTEMRHGELRLAARRRQRSTSPDGYGAVTQSDAELARALGLSTRQIRRAIAVLRAPDVRYIAGEIHVGRRQLWLSPEFAARWVGKALQNYQAPPVGLEPTTRRLTAACSTN